MFDEMQTKEIKQEDIISQSVSGLTKDISLSPKKKEEIVSSLTAREIDTFYLLIEGFTLKEAAAQLGIKYSTANTHMTGVYRKLKVNSRAELIIKYRNIMK
jgi:DNA-binding CsgD family transcriptional regulator